MSSARQTQSELLYLLGQLLGPLESPPSEVGDALLRRRALAQFSADLPTFIERLRSFTHPPGQAYTAEYRTVLRELSSLSKQGPTFTSNAELYRETVAQTAASVRDAICSVPTTAEARILHANSPFSAYCFIRDLCETTSQRLVWIDRHFSSAVFYRYLRHVPSTVAVTLLTWPEPKHQKANWLDFIEASRLFALERGSDKYTLLSKIDFHDRWLDCDNSLYLLGGSGKDAGQSSDFSVSPMEASTETTARFSATIKDAVELFGKTTSNHP
ncbi:MAG: hypothetical protein K2X67_04085 [Burkholderiales bacterium]|nr:hypothetical protein [Burkholderiales bacterium]